MSDARRNALTHESIIVTADPPPLVARLLALLILCFLGAAAPAT